MSCIISLKESSMAQPVISFKGVSPTLGKNVYVDGSARIVGDVVLEAVSYTHLTLPTIYSV